MVEYELGGTICRRTSTTIIIFQHGGIHTSRHHTYMYARRRTFLSCAHHSAQFTHWSALSQCGHAALAQGKRNLCRVILCTHFHIVVMSLCPTAGAKALASVSLIPWYPCHWRPALHRRVPFLRCEHSISVSARHFLVVLHIETRVTRFRWRSACLSVLCHDPQRHRRRWKGVE